ncbi:hypothetical protein BEWA_026350 [Theileria equi strain WA]|uniref:GAF domain-containing protein n=1 Tax=Theileria equi strain WA TaxID=1537102 RepID=L0AXP1_THEEQ|nr:hypothetical protein BEWA_026350 [Theileria equi strain WA]AFZ79786.1 hypothetical protein BEWA_026350 [Theileria equi strain WA]|eukprot:XP_004829452.1 hypothetical protein BEWA_026350 [Theileria equi strain WA]
MAGEEPQSELRSQFTADLGLCVERDLSASRDSLSFWNNCSIEQNDISVLTKEQLLALVKFSNSIMTQTVPVKAILLTLRMLKNTIHAEFAEICYPDKESHNLVVHYIGKEGILHKKEVLMPTHGAFFTSLRTGAVLRIPNCARDVKFKKECDQHTDVELQNILLCPLFDSKRTIWGVGAVGNLGLHFSSCLSYAPSMTATSGVQDHCLQHSIDASNISSCTSIEPSSYSSPGKYDDSLMARCSEKYEETSSDDALGPGAAKHGLETLLETPRVMSTVDCDGVYVSTEVEYQSPSYDSVLLQDAGLTHRDYPECRSGARSGDLPMSITPCVSGVSEFGSHEYIQRDEISTMPSATGDVGDCTEGSIVDDEAASAGSSCGLAIVGGVPLQSIPLPSIQYSISNHALLPWDENNVAFVLQVCETGGLCISNAMSWREFEANGERVDGLLALMHSLFSDQLGIQSCVVALTTHARKLIQAERCTVYIVDRYHNQLWSISSDDGSQIVAPLTHGLAAECVNTGQVIVVENACEDERFNAIVDSREGVDIRNVAWVPIKSEDCNRVLAVIEVINKQAQELLHFGEDDLRLLEIFSAIVGPQFEKSDFAAAGSIHEVTEAGLAFENLQPMSNVLQRIAEHSILETEED